jgi:autotransporter-associated beta strand protein
MNHLIQTGTNPILTMAGGTFATPASSSSVTGGLRIVGPVVVNIGDVGPIGVESVAGNFNVDGTTANPTFNVDFQNAGSFDQINATGTLNFTGPNKPIIHLALSSANGSAIVPGTYNLINFATPNAGLASNTFSLDPSTPSGPFSYSIATTSTAVELVVTPTLQWDTKLSGGSATIPITDGSGNWVQGSPNFYNTDGNPGPTTWDNAQSFDVTFGGNTPAQAGGAVTLAGPIVAGGQLNLEPVTSPYTFAASSSSNTLTTVGGIRDDSSAVITAPIKLADSQIWNVASGQTLTVDTVGETISSGINKFGSGTLLFSGPTSTYTGGMTITAGTVQIGSANALPTAGGIVLGTDSGALLDLHGLNQTIGSLAGNGSVTLGSSMISTLTISGSAATTFAGSITGTGNLIKLGSGTETLTGTGTFTGSTAVSAGSLIVNGSLSRSSTASIAAGGILGGTGTIGSVMNAGTVNPGSTGSTGTLSVGNLILGPGALSLDLSNVGTSDSVAASGTAVDITGSALSLNIGAINANETFTILSAPNATITGTFTNLADNTSTITVGSVTFGITYSAHSIVLTAQNAGSAATLVSTVLNGGIPYINSSLATHQHSMVESVVYSFSNPVSLSAANFTLSGFQGTPASLVPNVVVSGSSTVWTVTFSGTGVNNGTHSIGDGEYQLVLSGVPGLASNTYDFFRLLGDMDGNGTVDTSDFAALISTFLRATTDPLYLGADDFDGDGTIGTTDFAQFTSKFLNSVPTPMPS